MLTGILVWKRWDTLPSSTQVAARISMIKKSNEKMSWGDRRPTVWNFPSGEELKNSAGGGDVAREVKRVKMMGNVYEPLGCDPGESHGRVCR